MRRIAILLVLFTAYPSAAADLPPGVLARLGDDRFRAGGEIEYLALSPDGKQIATATWISKGVLALAVWDASTGYPIREYRVNRQLFKGFVWCEGGAFAVVTRAEPATKNQRAKGHPDDFRVWDFTKAAPPLLPQDTVGLGGPAWWVDADWPRGGPEYTDFRFSADGKRVAAAWKSADEKYAIHVFELKDADTAESLKRVASLDLGAEGIDDFRVSADGKSIVTFRGLANSNEMTATTWNVATGKPAKPVRVPFADRPLVTPDARTLVAFADDYPEWGFDRYDLATGEKRQFIRWKRDPNSDVSPYSWGGSFSPSGSELVAVVFAGERKTYVIDLTAGKERGHLEGHTWHFSEGAGNFTSVSANGNRIATADADGLIRLWDAKTLRAISDAPGHRAEVEYAQLSPDGKRLLTWAQDKTIRLWDITTGKELRAFVGATDDYRPVFALNGTAVIYHDKKSLIARDLQTGLEVPLPKNAKDSEPRAAIFSTAQSSAGVSLDGFDILVYETASNSVRRTLKGHRGHITVLGFTPDGTKLLTAGGDHTVLVWDMRLAHVPLPEAVKKETDAAKLWNTLAAGNAKDAYLAMARLAREPEAAVKMAKLKLKPAAKAGGDTDASRLADSRAIELLEALETEDSRTLLKELVGGHADAFRTQEAKRALERNTR